jgi:hypothetical protein
MEHNIINPHTINIPVVNIKTEPFWVKTAKINGVTFYSRRKPAPKTPEPFWVKTAKINGVTFYSRRKPAPKTPVFKIPRPRHDL